MIIAVNATADRTVEAANKQLVLDMWHEVLNGRNFAAAAKYIADDYIQHSPSAEQGLAGLMRFLTEVEFPGATPLEPGTHPLTPFVHVMAEGDLVQLMFQREIPNPKEPSETIRVWWYDTYRCKDGMIVEHWDSALE